jgi:hypothetical protein
LELLVMLATLLMLQTLAKRVALSTVNPTGQPTIQLEAALQA